MKRCLIFNLFLFLCFSQFAQKINQDSLWSVFKNETQPDTNRLKAIHSISRNYLNNNPDSAIILAQKELAFAKKTNQKKYQANAFNIIGTAYKNKGDYANSLENYLMTYKIREEMGDKQGVGLVYSNIGNVYYLQADYPKALEYYFKGLKIGEELGNKNVVGDCLF